jgi:hypothetical protein
MMLLGASNARIVERLFGEGLLPGNSANADHKQVERIMRRVRARDPEIKACAMEAEDARLELVRRMDQLFFAAFAVSQFAEARCAAIIKAKALGINLDRIVVEHRAPEQKIDWAAKASEFGFDDTAAFLRSFGIGAKREVKTIDPVAN